MRPQRRWWWPPLLAAGLLVFVLSGTFLAGSAGRTEGSAQERALDKEIHASLRIVINKGADLFNLQRDFAGCYRLYQGGLLAIRPLLDHHPDLQKNIDDGLAQAEAMPAPPDQPFAARAFALRKVLDDVRARLKSNGGNGKTVAKATERPVEKKTEAAAEKKTEKVAERPPEKKTEKVAEKKTEKATEKASLWDRLGGEDRVKHVVDDFVRLVENDPKVNFTRGGKYPVNNKELKKDLVQLISQYTGGPLRYTGPDMKDAHKGMKITRAEFDASVADLRKALDQNGVKGADADELLRLVEKTRKAIVQGSGGDTKKTTEPEKKSTSREDGTKKSSAENRPGPASAAAEGVLSGMVTYDGKPAPIGYLTLVGPDRKSYSTFVNARGSYRFKTRLPAGRYVVSYQPTADPAVAESALGSGRVPPVSEVRIPERYQRPETSDLQVTVNPGENTFDVILTK